MPDHPLRPSHLVQVETWLRRRGHDHMAEAICFVGLIYSGIAEVVKGE